jgi:hypothetical protein
MAVKLPPEQQSALGEILGVAVARLRSGEKLELLHVLNAYDEYIGT